jgi:hypothetical protein
LGARGDESFREEAERVFCSGEGKVRPAAEGGKGGEGSPAVPIPDLWMNYGRRGVMPLRSLPAQVLQEATSRKKTRPPE